MELKLRAKGRVPALAGHALGLLLAHKCLRIKVASFLLWAGEVRKLIFEEVLIKIWQSVVEIQTGANLSLSGRLFQQ